MHIKRVEKNQIETMKALKRVTFPKHPVQVRHISPPSCEPQTFFAAFGPYSAISQVFGVMPVRGVMANHPEKLRFKLLSLRTWYAILLVISQIWFLSHIITAISRKGFTIHKMSMKISPQLLSDGN